MNNITVQYGYTPLDYAALIGHTEIASLLIRNGADIGRKDEVSKLHTHT